MRALPRSDRKMQNKHRRTLENSDDLSDETKTSCSGLHSKRVAKKKKEFQNKEMLVVVYNCHEFEKVGQRHRSRNGNAHNRERH